MHVTSRQWQCFPAVAVFSVFLQDFMQAFYGVLVRSARPCATLASDRPLTVVAALGMEQQGNDQMQPKGDKLKPEISPQAQQEQQEGGVPPAKPTGTLQDLDPNELMTKRNQVQAVMRACCLHVTCKPFLQLVSCWVNMFELHSKQMCEWLRTSCNTLWSNGTHS